MKNLYSRDQVIEWVGLEAVERVERENCEPTCRVGFNGLSQGDALLECKSSVSIEYGEADTLSAYYYVDNEAERAWNETGDGSSVDWEACLEGFEIE